MTFNKDNQEMATDTICSEANLLKFVQVLDNLLQKDKTGTSKLQQSSIDLLYWYKVQNLFHEYFISDFKQSQLNSYHARKTVCRALEIIVDNAHSCVYFGLDDSIFQFIETLLSDLKENSVKERKETWNLVSQLIIVFDSVLFKLADRKENSRLIGENSEVYDPNRKSYIQKFDVFMENIVKMFRPTTKLMLELLGKSVAVVKQEHEQINQFFGLQIAERKEEFFAFYAMVASAISLIMNGGLRSMKNKRLEFEENLPPEMIINEILKLFKLNCGDHCPANVFKQLCKILLRFTLLDLHKDFGYPNERLNPFFSEMCKHFSDYSQKLNEFAEALTEEYFRVEMIDITRQSHIQSQQGLNQFLQFLFLMVRIKTKGMQGQLFPQLSDPLVQIISTKPFENKYLINLDCQKSALKILKEITKTQTFDDSNHLQKLLDRLKVEFDILHEDLKDENQKHWIAHHRDDSESFFFSLAKRQEFISSCLRFLCYSIIRTDPNAANSNPQFVAHSRRILESKLFEEKIEHQVFKSNEKSVSQNYKKVVDPIYLYCIQLFTYVINDLPQKLQDYIKLQTLEPTEDTIDPNNLVPVIVYSLVRRIPLQQDLFMMVTKFLKMLSLHHLGTRLLLESNIIQHFLSLSLDSQYYKHLVMPRNGERMMECRIMFNNLSYENQWISDCLLACCIQNIEKLTNEAWQLTEEYVIMEKETVLLSDQEKEPIKQKYNQKQIKFEQKLEAAVALLNYYCLDELEYMEDLEYVSNVQKSLRKNNPTALLMKLIEIPIVCSGADNFVFYFQETLTFIKMLEIDSKYEVYIKNLDTKLKVQIKSLKKLLNVTSFDTIQFLDPKKICKVELPDLYMSENQEKTELLRNLSSEDLLWVTLAKIYILLEMLADAENLPRLNEGLQHVQTTEQVFMEIAQKNGSESLKAQIHELQSMLDRHHTWVFTNWQESLYDKFLERREKLNQMFSTKEISWQDYKLDNEVRTEEQENRNLYYIFEHMTIPSYMWCSTVSKEDPNLMFDLAESQIRYTHKCWKKSRYLLTRFSDIFKRHNKMVHIRLVQDPKNLAYNQLSAELCINEIKNILEICSSFDPKKLLSEGKIDISHILMVAGRVTWTLPDIIDIVSAKSLRGRGPFIITLLKEGIIELLVQIVMWAVRLLQTLEQKPGLKFLFLSQDIHDVLRQTFKLIKAFIDGTFMSLGNLQNMLVPFKQNPSEELTGVKAIEAEQSLCAAELRNELYRSLYRPCSAIFFDGTGHILLQFSVLYQRDMLEIIASIFSQLCGGFKSALKSSGVLDLINNPKSQGEKAKPISLSFGQTTKSIEVDMLVEMGFDVANCAKALELNNNSFDAALEMLLNKKDIFDGKDTKEPDALQLKKLEQQENQYNLQFDSYTILFQELMDKVTNSFVPFINQYFFICNLSTQQQFVNNLFRLNRCEEKANTEKQLNVSQSISKTLEKLFNEIQISQTPDWIKVDFTLQMLKHLSHDQTQIHFHLDDLLRRIQTNAEAIQVSSQLKKPDLQEGLSKKEQIYQNELITQRQLDKKAIDQQKLLNINELFKLALIICNNVQVYQESKIIDTLMKEQAEVSNEALNPDQLASIKDIQEEEKKKQFMLREKWQQIVQQLKGQNKVDNEMIDTSSNSQILTLFKDEKEAGQLMILVFSGIEALLKAFSNIQPIYYTEQQDGITCCLQKAFNLLRTLGEIQQIGGFDFRKAFVQSDLLKVIFEVKIVDETWDSQVNNWAVIDKQHYSLLREVFEAVWCQPKDQQRIYETLVKRQMFFQFKQNFKREENKEVIECLKQLSRQVQSPTLQAQTKPHQDLDIQQSQMKPKTKKHQQNTPKLQQPDQKTHKRSKSEEKKFLQKTKLSQNILSKSKAKESVWLFSPEQCSQKLIKKFIKKNEGYNKSKFADFLNYYDSGAFGMQLKRIDIFIAAVTKLCIIKTEIETQEVQGKIQNRAETKIMLKRNILRELLQDPDYHTIVSPVGPINHVNRVQFEQELAAWKQISQNQEPTRTQQDLTNQMLEVIIQQTKGYKMDLIKMFREPAQAQMISLDKYKTNDTVIQVESAPISRFVDKKITKRKIFISQDSKCPKKMYLFDMFSIFNVFANIQSLNLPIAELILKHNDRKTLKFLFRNIYLLFSMNIEITREIVFKPTLESIQDQKIKLTVLSNFLNSLLLTNFGTKCANKIVREELQRVFISQVAKQINSINDFGTEGPEWANDARLICNYCPIWLITNFITTQRMEEKNAKDAAAAILQKKFKQMRLQRVQMIKLLIIECQQNSKKSVNCQDFALLANLQKIADQVVNQSKFFFNSNKPSILSTCIFAISNVVKLFENNTSIFSKQRRQLKVVSEDKLDSSMDQNMMEQGEIEFGEEGEDEIEEIDDQSADLEEEKDSDMSEEEKSEDDSSDENSYGSDFDDMHNFNNDLSSHRSESRSFDEDVSESEERRVRNIGEIQSNEWSEYDEDYGSSEDSWEQGIDLLEAPANEPQVIVTTKQDNNSPRRQASFEDYDEEDSSSNFIDNVQLESEEEISDEEGISNYYDEQEEEFNQRTETVNESFNSYAEYDPSRATQQIHDHDDNWQYSHSDNGEMSQSVEQRDQNALLGQVGFLDPQTNFMNILNGPANPFAEAPLNIELNIQQINMQPGNNNNNQIQKILEQTIGSEMENRQIDYFGQFGLQMSMAKERIKDFKKAIKTNGQLYKINTCHYFAFVANEKPLIEEETKNQKEQLKSNLFDQVIQQSLKQMPKKSEFGSKPIIIGRIRPSALEIEGMDPLFMENLTSVGLQNIADSHQIHNQISNQARSGFQSRSEDSQNENPVAMLQSLITFLGSQTPERRLELLNSIQTSMHQEMSPEMLDAARNLYQANGQDFTRILNELRNRERNQSLNVAAQDLRGLHQLQQNNYQIDPRQRLISMSSYSYDIRGVDETLDQNQEQAIQTRPSQQQQNDQVQKPKLLLPIQECFKSRIQLKVTQFMQNFYLHLQQQIISYEQDPLTLEVNRQAESVLIEHLIPQNSDTAATIFNKLKGPVNLALTAFKNFEETADFQLVGSSLMIVDKIPHLRSCLNLNVLSILNLEVKRLLAHRDGVVFEGNTATFFEGKQLVMGDQSNARALNMQEVIFIAVNCINQMQEIGAYGIRRIQKQKEIILQLNQQPILFELSKLVGNIDANKSIFEGLLDAILIYFETIDKHPWLMPTRGLESNDEFQDKIFKKLMTILKGIQRDCKTIRPAQTECLLPIGSICKLFLNFLNSDNKVAKTTIPIVRKALNACCYNKQSSSQVSGYIQVLLNSLLENTIQKLQLKTQDDNETFSKQIEQISQLLKISGGLSRINMENVICSEKLLLDVFNTASQILQTESQQQTLQPSKQVNQFMHRQDIKELVTLLFSLSEYSLKTIFSNQNSTQMSSLAPNIQTQTQNRFQQVGEEISSFQIDESASGQNNPAKDSEMEENTLSKIEHLLEKHISKSSAHYERFKTMVSFFIINKKLLNLFIRVNQQVINNELKNLVLKIPQILEFDTKRLIWRIELKKQHAKQKRVYRVAVSRERAFDDSFAHLQSLKADEWKGKFDIQFVGEDGIDQGGLTKEWFMLLSKQMFDENLALFIKADNGSTYFPNPKSTVQNNFIELFNFVGKIIGKALWEQQLLDCYFVKAFYKMILDIPLDLHDLEDYDQSLYKSLLWILQNQHVENLSSYFVETMDYFGTSKEMDLVPDGHNKLVTDENKEEYVRLVANFKLDKAILEQKNAFLAGFYALVPKDLIKLFDNRELELLISGLQTVDIDDLKENTVYNGYNARSRPVLLLWEVLNELENSERAEFIQFVTGSSKVPIEGFKGLRGPDGLQKFTITRIQTHGQIRLPQSHTCVNTLDLPEYKDKETLKKMLLLAIREGKNFGIA